VLPRVSLKVKAGDPLSASVWDGMVDAVAALTLFAGPGIELNRVPGTGTIISRTRRAGWVHPWQVALSGEKGARIRPGLINGVMPTIDDEPMDGGKTGRRPQMKWQKLLLDITGLGYVAVEITCDKAWAVESAKCVQVATLDTENGQPREKDAPPGYSAGGIPGLPGRRARYPLAMIRKRKSGKLALFQIPYFNLQHRAAVRDAKKDIARHFFW
jgi:hypothetical protein